MILFEKFTQDGIKIHLALAIANIVEVSPNSATTEHSWIKYWDGSQVRSAVVIGNVVDIVKRIQDIKASYAH